MSQGETPTIHLNESPWGQPPRKPKPLSPKGDGLNDWLDKGRNHFNHLFSGDSKPTRNPQVFLMILLASLFVWLASGFYTIEPEEEGVVIRFGHYSRLVEPGLNYHLPAPFERVLIEKVTRIEREEIGYRSTGSYTLNLAQTASAERNIAEESLMLTGDENIVDINFEVQWKIKNLKDFLFNVYRPKDTVKSAAESAMREVIGNTPIAAALAEGRSAIELKTKTLLQSILDSYGTGIEIVRLQMLKVDPPAEVVDAFRDVQTARADKEREINQAETYQNDVIPRARGDAARLTQEAQAYKQEVVAHSKGDASRFLAIYNQYKNAKDVTKRRIYLETMEEIFSGMDKVIFDGKGTQGVVPYLPLPGINKKKE